jgi:hypothetical protein
MFSIDMGSISMEMLRNAQSVATGMVYLIRCLLASLPIFDLRTGTPMKFADMLFAD